jgi:hypothetical protein
MPGIAEILENGVIFEGGEERPFDAIIFATGYRSNFQNFLHFDKTSAIRMVSIPQFILWSSKIPLLACSGRSPKRLRLSPTILRISFL